MRCCDSVAREPGTCVALFLPRYYLDPGQDGEPRGATAGGQQEAEPAVVKQQLDPALLLKQAEEQANMDEVGFS